MPQEAPERDFHPWSGEGSLTDCSAHRSVETSHGGPSAVTQAETFLGREEKEDADNCHLIFGATPQVLTIFINAVKIPSHCPV